MHLDNTASNMSEHLNLNNEIVIYQSEDGNTQLDIKSEGGSVWFMQVQMANYRREPLWSKSSYDKEIDGILP